MDVILYMTIVALLALAYFFYQQSIYVAKIAKEEKDKYSKLLSQKKSSEVRLGQISENLAPFLKDFKYDPKSTHFMGMPIDYIIFEDDKIIFLEIKSGKSTLSSKQRNIKQLILDGKVFWDVMRIN